MEFGKKSPQAFAEALVQPACQGNDIKLLYASRQRVWKEAQLAI